MNETPLLLLVDGGTLASFGEALQRIGYQALVRPSFDEAIAGLQPTAGAVIYFDPGRTPRPENFEIRVRNAGTAVLLVAVASGPSPASHEPLTWHDCLQWPIALADLEAVVARQLDEAQHRRRLFEIGSRFARGLHDIRTPLGGIKGYASTLNAYWDRMGEHDRREAVQIIEAEVDRVTELLEELSSIERELRRGEWRG